MDVLHGHMQAAFSNGSNAAASSGLTLPQLPTDVLTEVCARLTSPSDIAAVSRTCRMLQGLSASPMLAAAWLLRARPKEALVTAAGRGMASALHLISTHAPAHGLDLQLNGPPGTAALSVAARRGYCEAVRVLLAHGVPADGCDGDGAPLAAAAGSGHITVMQLLLSGVAQGTSQLQPQQASSSASGEEVLTKDAECVKSNPTALRLGVKGMDVEAEQRQGQGAGGGEGAVEDEENADAEDVAAQEGAYWRLMGTPHGQQAGGLAGGDQLMGTGDMDGGSGGVRAPQCGISTASAAAPYPSSGSSTVDGACSSAHLCSVQCSQANMADVHAGQDAALIAAATAGQEGALALLLAAGATAGARSGEALCCAAAGGHMGCARQLMVAGCGVGLRQGEALRWAAMEGHLEMLCLLWEEGGGSAYEGAASAALALAARGGHAEVVRQLLAWGADVHAGEEDALVGAAGAGHAEIVLTLVAAGADVRAQDGRALRAACEGAHTEAVRVLLEAGADPGVGGQAPIKAAARAGSLPLLRLLLAAGADPHTGDEAPLRSAASVGALDVVQELLGEPWRADPNANDQEALLWAADNGHAEVVQALLEAGAEAGGQGGALVLWAAVSRGHSSVVRLLMDHGSSLLAWHMLEEATEPQVLGLVQAA